MDEAESNDDVEGHIWMMSPTEMIVLAEMRAADRQELESTIDALTPGATSTPERVSWFRRTARSASAGGHERPKNVEITASEA